MFVTKKMRLTDWPVFQDKFAEKQIALCSSPDFALFYRNYNGVRFSTIAASGLDLSRANSLSPGGWCEVEHLDGSGWALVGEGDVHIRLGVHLGKP